MPTRCFVPISQKHDEKTGWGPWIRAEELNCGPVLPEGSRKSCSDSLVKSSMVEEEDMESLKDPINLERRAGGTQKTVKSTAEISNASSHSCLVPNVNPPKESFQTLNADISNGRKRKILEDSRTCPPKGRGGMRGSKTVGKSTAEVGRIQGRGLKTGQVYKPKNSIQKIDDYRESTLGGVKKKTKGEEQVAPDSKTHTPCRKSLERTTDPLVSFIPFSVAAVNDAPCRYNPISSANGSGGGCSVLVLETYG